MSLHVYSGECRLCDVGVPTPFTDMAEKPLATGDIVAIYAVDGGWGSAPDHLTVVVSDQYTTYSNYATHPTREHRQKEGPVEFYVMGIKSVPMDAPGIWRVVKVKDHSDVVNGEHWKAYGFCYRAEDNA